MSSTSGCAVEDGGVHPSNSGVRGAPFGSQISRCEATCSCDNLLRIKRAKKNMFGYVVVMPRMGGWMDG